MAYKYEMRFGSYALVEEGTETLCIMMPEVALVFDKENGTLLKHGRPDLVKAYYDKTVGKLRDGGALDMANDLAYIVGPFDVEELNRCLSTSGYVLRMYEKLQLTPAV